MKKNKIKLPVEQYKELLATLKNRFEKNKLRHKALEWVNLEEYIENLSDSYREEKLFSIYEMERTGGEPDVVGYDKKTGEYIFYDCSAETPEKRRSICYDHEALDSRKEHKPLNSATNMASEMGIEILTEEQYRELQKLGTFDKKTSSWIKTPEDIRSLGGALFADFRYGKVFVYHNGAQSYYSGRGFRGSLKV